MDDVIFAGTNSRPARNNAEVAIADRQQRRARRPPQFNEHETLDVSRRIEREHGSTYRINGREVRARDVQILFADASTGSRSPALVHQGRIGEIIQAKPEQRRRVLEEAAGISGPACAAARGGAAAARGRAEPGAARGRDRPARRPDGRAQAAGAPGGPLPRGRRSRCARPRRRCSTCAGSPPMPNWPRPSTPRIAAVRLVAERTGEQAEAATRQAIAAAELPALRDAEASAAAALQRLVMARETLEREESARQGAHGRARPPARAARATTSSASGAWPPTRKPRSAGSPPRKRRLQARDAAANDGAARRRRRARRPRPTRRSRRRRRPSAS